MTTRRSLACAFPSATLRNVKSLASASLALICSRRRDARSGTPTASVAVAVRRGRVSGSRAPQQGLDQFVLLHGVPAGDLLLLGHRGQVSDRSILQICCSHHDTHLHVAGLAAVWPLRVGSGSGVVRDRQAFVTDSHGSPRLPWFPPALAGTRPLVGQSGTTR